MMWNMIHSVFFDLDGTLFDTLEDIRAAINYALKAYDGTEASPDEVRRYVGRGLRRALAQAVAEHCPPLSDDGEFELLLQLMMGYYRTHPGVYTVPYPGIPELLGNLVQNGIAVGVVSNKTDDLVKAVIEHYGYSFGFVSGQRSDYPLKPDPSLLLHAIEAVGSDAAHSVYVGDSEVDAETGKRAGINTFIVSYGFRRKEELEAAGIEKTLENTAELASSLSAYFLKPW